MAYSCTAAHTDCLQLHLLLQFARSCLKNQGIQPCKLKRWTNFRAAEWSMLTLVQCLTLAPFCP